LYYMNQMDFNMDKASKIYVPGHTGLIGSAIVKSLKEHGYNNVLIKTHEQLDLLNREEVFKFFEKERPEYVILCAGKVGGIVENKTFPADFISINLAIQQNVIGAAHRNDVKKLIFFGSSCMYPRECQQPMAESALFSGVPEPTSMAYAVAKMAGVQMCLAYNQQFGEKRFVPVVPNSAYGPNDNFNPESGHVLSALIRRFHEAKLKNIDKVTLWGSGSPKREFIHTDDIASACLRLLEADISSLELPVNLGSGSDVSIRELAEAIAKTIGYVGNIEWDTAKPDGAPRKLLDSSRINEFGWTPNVSFESGLKSTYEWYVNNQKEQQ
jgi:GDP-L-fucose synthase